MRIFAQRPFFGTWSPCVPTCSCVVCHICACFDVFSFLLAVFTSPRASICTFRRYYHVTLKIENYHILGIVMLVERSLERQEDALLLLINDYNRFGWTMGTCPERYTHFCRFLRLNTVLSNPSLLARTESC